MRTAKSCGSDASVVGVKSVETTPPVTVSNKPDRREEHEVSRKPLRGECPGDFRRDRGDLLACFLFCTQGCGRVGRPAFPAPSFQREPDQRAKLEQIRAARSRNYVSSSLRGATRPR